jgi:hypothetical protein
MPSGNADLALAKPPAPPSTPPFPAQVFVKTLSGKTITIFVEEDATVEEVKERVEEKEGVPSHMQRLFWGGKHLQGQTRICNLGIEAGATLHLSLPMRGGMPKKVNISNIDILM